MENSINPSFLLKVSNIAIKAGIEIMTFYGQQKEVIAKEDNSPLTKADLASNKIIIEELNYIDPSIPALSEEKLVEWSIRKNWQTYWLIDPLDGTKEFINENGEFTVNIALIQNNSPILGVIYAPALKILYFASFRKGSFKINTDQALTSLQEAKKLNIKTKNKFDKISIFNSRSHTSERFEKWVKDNYSNYSLIKRGSSIKFCEIADGSVDLYPRFGPTNEWDIAAGHIILTESGGKIKNLNLGDIFYNYKESLLNPYFIASCKFQ
jgi:3'(2'), 5'-bisphosphate nucleotidase